MGPIVRAVRDLYFAVVRGQVAKYRHWCTPVYQSVIAPTLAATRPPLVRSRS
jgi:hypothetical protein